jgi:nicotinamide riboside transporter PnuC
MAIFALIFSLLYFLYFFLLKNIDFYGGGLDGLLGMISHGFGLFLNPEPVLENCASSMTTTCAISLTLVTSTLVQIIAIVVLTALIFILGALLHTSDFSPMAKRTLAVCAVGGVFGFTTLMCFLVSLPILVRKTRVSAPFHD